MVATPLAFHTIQVSTVVAAHWMSPEAMARWRLACGIFLRVTSRPFAGKDATFLGKDERRETRPPGNTDRNLGPLRTRRRGRKQCSKRCRDNANGFHLPLRRISVHDRCQHGDAAS